MTTERRTVTFRRRGDEVWLEDDWWPAHLLVDAALFARFFDATCPGARYDPAAELLVFELSNGWARYALIGPTPNAFGYAFDCIGCARDLDDG